MVNIYEKNNNIYYKSDFIEFICESKIEDFEDFSSKKVVVSTIHMSKGHEFDTVYLMLNNFYLRSDEEKRRLYVGASRAKNNLYIHTNTDCLRMYNDKESLRKYVSYIKDSTIYDEPKEMYIYTSHKSVKLGDFYSKTKTLESIFSGYRLSHKDNKLYTIGQYELQVARFSEGFKEKLDVLFQKGYEIVDTKIEHIVYWQSKDEPEKGECLVPLVLLHLVRTKDLKIVNDAPSINYKPIVDQLINAKSSNIQEKQIKMDLPFDETNLKTNQNESKVINNKSYDNNQKKLISKLRKYRMDKSLEGNISVAYVFGDKSMYSIVKLLPISIDEFYCVDGIGVYKAEKYGDDIVKICKEFVDNNPEYKIWHMSDADIANVKEKIRKAHGERKIIKDGSLNIEKLRLELKEYRSNIANALQVPCSVVFSDETLSDIVKKIPTTINELRKINGIEESNINLLSNGILNICKKYK